jgi:hypothetical protein
LEVGEWCSPRADATPFAIDDLRLTIDARVAGKEVLSKVAAQGRTKKKEHHGFHGMARIGVVIDD